MAGRSARAGGGGKRVSAATAGPSARPEDAPDLVQIRPWDGALDTALAELDYGVVDETVLYAAPLQRLNGPLPPASAFWTERRLAVMEDIWAAGGIGPGRLAVMDRASGPKTSLLCRAGDRAAGVGFVAMAEGVAMVHAVEVLTDQRRKGGGRLIMRVAANWAARQGADRLAIAVTLANAPARTLYERLGMAEATRYHYRERTK